MKKRIFEIDFLRFLAIVLMVIYHLGYDIQYFLVKNINFEGQVWTIIGKTSGFLFIFVAGISSGFSRNSFKRGKKVFLAGMLVTLATFIFIRNEYVRFGILHFLGICMMLYPLLNRLTSSTLALFAIVSAYLGYIFKKITVKTFLLLPLGIYYNGFVSIDYYPLFPYLAYFLLGIIVYKNFYSKGKMALNVKKEFKIIEYINQNSLLIYLLHQPILLAIIYLIRDLQK